MADYTKNYFWTITDSLNDRHYFFKVEGKLIEVDKAVYQVCFNSYVKNLRRIKRDIEIGCWSLDYVSDEGHNLIDKISEDTDLEYNVMKKILIEKMYIEINKLDDAERSIIISNYFEGKSMRELAAELKMPLSTLQDKKKRVLNKLQKELSK